jgi:hypothetical protein
LQQLDTLDVAKVQGAIDQALEKSAPLSIKINQPPSGSTVKRPLNVRVQDDQSDSARIRIVIEIDK